MNAILRFLKEVRTGGVKRASSVKTVSMGRERVFEAWDRGADTFVIEKGIGGRIGAHPSMLIVRKRDLGTRAKSGYVMTLSGGNHSSGAIPLLGGKFWNLCALGADERSKTMTGRIICANAVDGRVELSKREVDHALLFACDDWLMHVCGFAKNEVVLAEREDGIINHYRRFGEEWRVKPLAWNEVEIRTAIAASDKNISTSIRYYHSAKGVHFLSYSEFCRFAALAGSDMKAFLEGLEELVGVYEGSSESFTRMSKLRGHHEIEFFGLRRGTQLDTLVPALEELSRAIAAHEIGRLGVVQKADEIARLFGTLLSRPELADENGREFAETLYMYLTGEIYSVVGEGSTPAFDDRRTALPGGRFENGTVIFDDDADIRTRVLFTNIIAMMSKGERIEYANVYELRDDDGIKVGNGSTREIEFKTNMRPLPTSLIEKSLASRRRGYADYLLARIGALRSLGISLSPYYRILRPGVDHNDRLREHYIRMRCPGEPLSSVPAGVFAPTLEGERENRETVCALATLMGDAAAQTMAMKKYDPALGRSLFGIGKEIYDFGHDVISGRETPQNVAICSIRGSFGWPDVSMTAENFERIKSFYFGEFAQALAAFANDHTVGGMELAQRFMGGFEHRTHAMKWRLSVMRREFEAFNPPVERAFAFDRKWRFVMWAIERQDEALGELWQMMFRLMKAGAK